MKNRNSKKRVNQFDQLVSSLSKEFSKIPNFNLIGQDEKDKEIFNLISHRIADISAYKELVCSHFIPAVNKVTFKTKKDFKTSIYKAHLSNIDIDLNETLHDTIRLSYVAVFHKLESFVNDIEKIFELFFEDDFTTKESLKSWVKSRYNFDLKNWHQFYVTHKFNWVCNCVKHKDGFPVKTPKPERCEHFPEHKRIKIGVKEFKLDCELLLQFIPVMFRAMFLFGQHRISIESHSESELVFEKEFIDKEKELMEEMENRVLDFVRLLKSGEV